MPQGYSSYTHISVKALEFNPKSQDTIQKKQEILTAISGHYGSSPATVLFIGFNPMIIGSSFKQIYVTEVTAETKKFLDKNSIKYTYIDANDLGQYQKKFNWVIAGEEYFTFAGTEEEQKAKIELAASLAKDLIVTTLRDYKNQDFKEREFSQPLAVHDHNDTKLFVEYHHYDFTDRNAWSTTVYELHGMNTLTYGPYARRSMFFKQMAKFSIDAGAKNFYVHKNLMYKSLIKKNYEHVISISF